MIVNLIDFKKNNTIYFNLCNIDITLTSLLMKNNNQEINKDDHFYLKYNCLNNLNHFKTYHKLVELMIKLLHYEIVYI